MKTYLLALTLAMCTTNLFGSSFLKRMLNSGGAAKPAAPSEDAKSEQVRASMAKITDVIEIIGKKIAQWESQKTALEQAAKKSGIKTKAAKQQTMLLMKRRAMLIKNIQNMQTQQDNLELQRFALESVMVTSTTVAAMRQGVQTQQNILDLGEAQYMMDEFQASMDDQADLLATMAETVGPQMDESEFDEEWAAFEAEQFADGEGDLELEDIPDAGRSAPQPKVAVEPEQERRDPLPVPAQ